MQHHRLLSTLATSLGLLLDLLLLQLLLLDGLQRYIVFITRVGVAALAAHDFRWWLCRAAQSIAQFAVVAIECRHNLGVTREPELHAERCNNDLGQMRQYRDFVSLEELRLALLPAIGAFCLRVVVFVLDIGASSQDLELPPRVLRAVLDLQMLT
jgi:hypothetical protein